MNIRRLATVLAISTILVAPAALAKGKSGGSRLEPPPIPSAFSATLDGAVFTAYDGQGTLWAVWTYRRGLERDIAVSYMIGRTWSVPEILGTNNGLDDLDPRIGFSHGFPVVIWWQDGPQQGDERVVMSTRANNRWNTPVQLSDGPGSHPQIFNSSADENGNVGYGYIATDGTYKAGGVEVKPVDPKPEGGSDGPDPFPTIVIQDPTKRNQK